MARGPGVLVQNYRCLLPGHGIVGGKEALPPAGDKPSVLGPLHRHLMPAAVRDIPPGRGSHVVVFLELLCPAAALGEHGHQHGPAHGGMGRELSPAHPGEQARLAHVIHCRGVPGVLGHIRELLRRQAVRACPGQQKPGQAGGNRLPSLAPHNKNPPCNCILSGPAFLKEASAQNNGKCREGVTYFL